MMRTYLYIGLFLYLGQLQFNQVYAAAAAAAAAKPKDDPLLADEGSGYLYSYDRGYNRFPLDAETGTDDEDYLTSEGSADGGIYSEDYDPNYDGDYFEGEYDEDYGDYENERDVRNESTSTTESNRFYDPYDDVGTYDTNGKPLEVPSTISTMTTTTTALPPVPVEPSEDVSDFNIIEHGHHGHSEHERDHREEVKVEEVAAAAPNPDRTLPKYSPDQNYGWVEKEEEVEDSGHRTFSEGSGYGPYSSIPGREDEEDPDDRDDVFFVPPPPDFDDDKKEEVLTEEDIFVDIFVDERQPIGSVPQSAPPREDPPMSIIPSATPVEETHKDMDTSIRILTQKDVERQVSIFAQPGILAAFIGGAVIGLLCAILLVMFIVYRMRKRDEGSYPLDEPKRMPLTSSYSPNDKEIYA